MALSFAKKGDITKYFSDTNKYQYLVEKQEKAWQGYVDGAASFIVKDKGGRIVGVAINSEFHFKPSDACTNPHPDDFSANVNALADFLCVQIM